MVKITVFIKQIHETVFFFLFVPKSTPGLPHLSEQTQQKQTA